MRRILALSVILLTACGGSLLQSLRATFTARDPLLNALVRTEKITQEKADQLRTDFDDGIKCADTLAAEFKAVPKDAPDVRVQKLNASARAGRCWKTIVLRQNFAADPRVQRVADLIDGAFSAFIVFYSEPGEARAIAGAATVSRDEKELEREVELIIKQIKAAMKP